jgi:hypothetical protein
MFEDMLNNAMDVDTELPTDELSVYLAQPLQPGVRDALKWWYDNRFTFPRLSRMARDYLSIPGMFSPFSFLLCLTPLYSNFRRRRAGVQPWAHPPQSSPQPYVCSDHPHPYVPPRLVFKRLGS